MKYSDKLKAKQIDFYAQAKAISDKDEISAEDQTAFDAFMKSAEDLNADIAKWIEAESKLEKVTAPQARKTVDNPGNVAITTSHNRQEDNPTRGYEGISGFGKFAQDVHRFNGNQGMSENLKIACAAGDGLAASVATDGGILMPPAFSSTIMDLVGFESDSLISECDNLPALPKGVESMEYPAVNETSRADGSRAGGIQGYWKSELSQMTSSKPTLKEVKYSPQQLYVFAFASDKMLDNAPQLSAWLAQRAADEISFKIGDSIFNGTGVGMPRGVLNGATDVPRVQIAKESNQAAASLVVQNFEKMYARMPAKWIPGAKWYINIDTLPQLLDMSKAVGAGGSAVWMPNFNIAGAPFGQIYGRPIYPTEYNPTLGTEGDIIFANMKKYGIMTRGSIETGMSIHLKFDFNQSCFRFIFEIDGQPWLSSSITPFKGTAKQSSFITLATRS